MSDWTLAAADGPEASYERAEWSTMLLEFVGMLDGRERLAVAMYYGLAGEAVELRHVGAAIRSCATGKHVTAGRASQIVGDGVRDIKRAIARHHAWGEMTALAGYLGTQECR